MGAGAAAAATVLSGCSDEVGSEFPNRAAASEIIEKGWIPKILPESASEINERHDLDLNTGHGTFRFNSIDAAHFKETLAPYQNSGAATLVPRANDENRHYEYYSYDDFALAIDWTNRIGEFWLQERAR